MKRDLGWLREKVVYRVRHLLDARPYDVLPRWWVLVAVLGSGGALIIGAVWAGKDFWVNILASLALLGPGLVLTNVFASQWRARRAWELEKEALATSAGGVVATINGYLMPPIMDLYRDADLPLAAPRLPDSAMMQASPPAALAFVHLELESHESMLRLLVRSRRGESPTWSDADLTPWIDVLSTMERTLARLEGRVRTAELRLVLDQWTRRAEGVSLVWKYGDKSETLALVDTLARGAVPVDLSSALTAAADIVKAADDFVLALWTAIGERQPAE